MSHRFLRYVREGAAAAITQRTTDTLHVRPGFDVQLTVSHNGVGETLAPPPLQLFGPGDVTGIDLRQVGRRTPEPDAHGVPTDQLAAIEFNRADFPWLFSPFAPDDIADTLTPWLCLVVVKQGAGITLDRGVPNSVLRLAAPASLAELPVLGQIRSWAHTQLDDATAQDDVGRLYREQPQNFRSRILSPRRLAGDTAYWACLVPTYEGGRLKGLGRPVDGTAAAMLAPAWTSTTQLPLELPVYDSWEFRTGEAGGFEELVRRLIPRPVPATVGLRSMDVSRPGGGLPITTVPPLTAQDQDGALGPVNAVHANPPVALSASILSRLNRSQAVTPPTYGRWHAAAITGSPGAPAWLAEINRDPVRRVAAGLGGEVVQAHQEEFMAAAWEQAGEILRANQLLRLGELARETMTRTFTRRFLPLASDLSLLALAGPAMARLRLAPSITLRGEIRRSCLPLLGLSGAFRKFVRLSGPASRRLQRLTDRPTKVGPVLRALATGLLPDPAPQFPEGATSIRIDTLEELLRTRIRPNLRERVTGVLPMLRTLNTRATQAACLPLDAGTVVASISRDLDPRTTIAARIKTQIELPSGVALSPSGVGPAMVAPKIPLAMYKPLSEIGQEWVLPGLGTIPPESMSILEPNRQFIESYFAGLNHEMARELLWRGFPTDQRGTVFDRFWDSSQLDVTPLHEWQGSLGSHSPAATPPALLVLILRGDLVRRFPGATVFLQQAKQTKSGRVPEADLGGDATALPLFSGQLGTDLRFVGFGLSAAQVKGTDPKFPDGYYVTFQEFPGDLRFGPLPTTDPLEVHMVSTKAADAMASDVLHHPFRLYVHASQLLP
jgi:hypothetical protein